MAISLLTLNFFLEFLINKLGFVYCRFQIKCEQVCNKHRNGTHKMYFGISLAEKIVHEWRKGEVKEGTEDETLFL